MPAVSRLPSGRYRVRWRDATGARHTAGKSFPTKSAARKFGEDREAEVRRGDHLDPRAGRILLKTYCDQWLETYVAAPRTITKVKGHIEGYIKKPVGTGAALGDHRLEELDRSSVQGWVKRLQDLGREPATVTAYHRTLTTILNGAVRDRRIRENVALQVTLPTIPPANDFYWEREEIDAIRGQLTRPLDLAVFEVLIGTGIRWGEMTALHKDRWHALRRQVSVVDVIEEEGGLRLRAYPKGKKRREVPMDQQVVDVVAAYLAETPPIPCGLDHGKRQRCAGLLFHDDGRPLSRHAWPRDVLAPAVARAEVRPGSPHDLRHTYASWLVIDGVPLRLVQELLGHGSIRVTERYSHLAPSDLQDPRLLASLAKRPTAVAQSVAHS